MSKKKLQPHIGIKSTVLIIIFVLLVAADLITKQLEEAFMWKAVIIPGFAEISNNIRNPGCAFSFLNQNPSIGQPILITVTIILLAFLIFGFIFLPERFTNLKISISFVAAGAFGNLIDRFVFHSVRDFFGLNMLINNGSLVYCNFADFFIVIGAVIAVIDLLFLNEWAVFPLTKKAKTAQAKRKTEDDAREKRSQDEDDGFDDSAE